MTTSKRTVVTFLKDYFEPLPEGEKRALFEREVNLLLKEYQQWHRDMFWGKNPSGVTKILFRKWLIENDCFFVSKKR